MIKMMLFRPFYLVLSIVLLSMPGLASAQSNNLYAENLIWKAGESNVLKICLDNNEVVNGIQFDMSLPEGFSVDDTAEVIKNNARIGKMTITFKETNKNHYRFLVYSFSGDAVKGQQGVIFSVPLKADDAVAKGTYSIAFSKASLSCVRVVPDTGCRIDDFKSSIELK